MDRRETRIENHATKARHGFACAVCGRQGSILAVETVVNGAPSTRCKACLNDEVVVRPFQWDEAQRIEAEVAPAEAPKKKVKKR